MIRNPVYGFEKPYLENLNKEILPYCDQIYFDDFDNLIAVKKLCENPQDKKSILICATISENAFLVTDILDNGDVAVSPLLDIDENLLSQRVIASNKIGILCGTKDDLKVDFGFENDKIALKTVKPSDAIYIKPYVENTQSYYFTNSKAFIIKNIMTDLIKMNFNNSLGKITFAFTRELSKGIHALGKSTYADEAYFLGFDNTIKNNISYAKKEGGYVSELSVSNIEPCVLKKDVTYANAYYMSCGNVNSVGIIMKYKEVAGNIIKISKNTINELTNLFATKQ